MKEMFLIAIPWLAAGAAFVWPGERTRPWLLPVAGGLHAALSLWLLVNPPALAAGAWFGFDPLARAVLPMVSLLFFVCSIYAVAYLKVRGGAAQPAVCFCAADFAGLFEPRRAGAASRPAVGGGGGGDVDDGAADAFQRHGARVRGVVEISARRRHGHRAVAARFVLPGLRFLNAGGNGDLTFSALAGQFVNLTDEISTQSHPWLIAAWVLLLAGYGTKMGLAPMHTWKPDVYGEAPGIVGALLAGGMTTMAFVAVLRVKQVVDAAGGSDMTQRTLLAFGLFSMLVAALFLLGTPDFKRMLAYSSVEHMGILAVGAALGGLGVWAALFHVWTNSLTKGALFLSAGNIRRAANARNENEVAGMTWCAPLSARMFVVGLFAITACPPFGPFFSELLVLRAAFTTGSTFTAVVFLGCLLFAFFGMTRLVFAIVDGRPRAAARATKNKFRETAGVILPPLAFLGFSAWLGLATPALLTEAWSAAVKILFPAP